jgi:tetratricopeptide (TPR) repeat protein
MPEGPLLSVPRPIAHLEDQDDPAYRAYKEAYNLVLDEKWSKARTMLAELLAQYPKSEYADDASYWRAYALRHIDHAQAVEAYRRFIKEFPKSKYYDDAVADLGDLNAPVVVKTTGDSAVVVIDGRGKGYAFAYGPNLRKTEMDMRRMEKELRRQGLHWKRVRVRPFGVTVERDTESPNREIQLKIDALHAIGESGDDEKTFHMLKDIVLDHKQQQPLRETALFVLADFDKFDIFPVLLEVAKGDTDEEMQNSAISLIGGYAADKEKAVTLLTEMFGSIPKNKVSQREAILFSIADIGNDKSVDFLSHLARTHEDYSVRSDAVYLLGSIGGERARAALYDVLKAK